MVQKRGVMGKELTRGKKSKLEREAAWEELIEEARYHYESLRAITGSVEQEPKDKDELIRTLNYVLGLTKQHYRNLMHCYSISNRIEEKNNGEDPLS